MNRTPDEIMEDLMAFEPTTEDPWTWRDRLRFWLTGRVSPRIYEQRMTGMHLDELRMKKLRAELDLAHGTVPKEG